MIVGWFVGRSVGWSVDQPVERLVGWWIGRSVCYPVGQAVVLSVGRFVGRSGIVRLFRSVARMFDRSLRGLHVYREHD